MTTTSLVHFSRGGRFICIAAKNGEAQTSDFAKVTCVGCLKNLLGEAKAGTKLASEISKRIQTLKVAK